MRLKALDPHWIMENVCAGDGLHEAVEVAHVCEECREHCEDCRCEAGASCGKCEGRWTISPRDTWDAVYVDKLENIHYFADEVADVQAEVDRRYGAGARPAMIVLRGLTWSDGVASEVPCVVDGHHRIVLAAEEGRKVRVIVFDDFAEVSGLVYHSHSCGGCGRCERPASGVVGFPARAFVAA